MMGGLGGGLATPFEVTICRKTGSSLRCVANRGITCGECVLFEPPLVMTRGQASVESSSLGLPEQSDEWLLTHLLLKMGKGRKWASQYVCAARAAEVESKEAVAWLCNDITIDADTGK
jgi:hypothetical protein